MQTPNNNKITIKALLAKDQAKMTRMKKLR